MKYINYTIIVVFVGLMLLVGIAPMCPWAVDVAYKVFLK